MKLINTQNNKFIDADPKTLTPGTPIPASSMNAIQDEIANVVTGYGLTIDETNDAQMKEALDGHFAPINSPSLTGIPITTNPDGKTDNQIATVAYVKQFGTETSLGYQAVQQGGGTSMGNNKLYLGADTTDATQIRVQVDSNAVGKLVIQEEDAVTYGISKIGYNHQSNDVVVYDTGNSMWRHLVEYSTVANQQYISSLPSGNNQRVSNIIWNTSSNLPAYYYGTNNSVSYSATTDWVEAGGYNVNGQVNFGAWIETGANRSMWGGSGTNGAAQSGDYVWSAGISCLGYGKMEATLQVTDVSGNGSDPRVGAHLYVKDYNGTQKDWYFNTAGRLRDPQANYVDALPKGAIIIWYGDSGSVPTGWVICDGSNGTPDLRDKTVVGAGYQSVGHTAGNWNATATTDSDGFHAHTGATMDHALTWGEMPNHYHTYSWKGITSEGHGTDTMGSGGDSSGWSGTNNTSTAGNGDPHSHGIQGDGAHTHNVTVSTQQPSYYLYYIMKTGT